MEKYVSTLVALVPDAKISYTGLDVAYENIEWLDERPQPSKAECDAAWPQVEYDLTYASVEAARKRRYQNKTDGLFFAAQRDGGDLSAWTAAVEQIKAELPYPAPIV
jgi:hypothetical protein